MMTPERPPSRSERLLRETLERNPASPPRAHKRRHSHVPPPTDDDDDQLCRAAFLCRMPATAASPVRPLYSHQLSQQTMSHSPSPTRDYYSHDSRSRSRAASPRPSSPSPRPSRRQSLQRSPASLDSYNLQRHNSTPVRKRSAPTSASVPTTIESPYGQALRTRLERVLIAGRAMDEREQSRERHQRRGSRDESAPGWPWSDYQSLSTNSSDHGHYHTHRRSRSKTDPLTPPPLPLTHHSRRATATALSTTPAPTSPYLLPTNAKLPPSSLPTTSSGAVAVRQQYYRNNSGSSTWTPPLTADASPVLSEPHAHSLLPEDVDVKLLLTPPPTPPLYSLSSNGNNTATGASSSVTATPLGSSARRPGVAMYRASTRESMTTDYSSAVSPYMYRRDIDGSVEQLALPLPVSFNARKASERCRMMEGYVSFAQVEGLGTPPDGVDDEDDHNKNNREMDGEEGKRDSEGKRGRGLIGTWARKLFVGVAATAQS